MAKIHETAIVGENVKLGENVKVMAYAVIRDDEGKISVGDDSNIQEHCVLHGAVEIGENVTVGHSAVLHGCKIGNNVLVGMNSSILDNVEIGDWCIIGAGAVIPPGEKIEAGSIVVGNPAKVLRKVTEKDKGLICSTCRQYLEE